MWLTGLKAPTNWVLAHTHIYASRKMKNYYNKQRGRRKKKKEKKVSGEEQPVKYQRPYVNDKT